MPRGSQSIDDVITRILAGDRASCEELVRENYAAVYGFLAHLTSDPEMAADITQDTFRAAWQELSKFDGRSSVASWLHRIAYNRFIDIYRKRRRDRCLQENLQMEFSRNGDATPPCATSRKETSEYLSSAVKQLSDDQRTIVYLHYFEGLSLRETAMVVGQAVGTIKWRLSAALARLRSIVDAESVQ
jgi:RNA polymerase sigma-70 factor (ECF subfamily)